MTRVRPLAERFWPKVDKRGADDCWPWMASTMRGGYGEIRISRRYVPAHRVAYELTIGPIPDGQLCCHRCDNPPCCNPGHLFLGTTAENNADCLIKGRHVPPRGEMSGKA